MAHNGKRGHSTFLVSLWADWTLPRVPNLNSTFPHCALNTPVSQCPPHYQHRPHFSSCRLRPGKRTTSPGSPFQPLQPYQLSLF